jgi:hypothetical protein
MNREDVLWDRIADACDRLRETRGAYFALWVFYKWLRWADIWLRPRGVKRLWPRSPSW